MDQSLPKYTDFEGWERITNIKRRATYDLLASGKLRAVKLGKRSLIDVQHGLEFLESLPEAVIRPQNRSKKDAA
jgi:hypothetical protein